MKPRMSLDCLAISVLQDKKFCKILSSEGEARTAVKFPFKLSRVGHLARMFLSLPPPWGQPEAETS